MLSALYLPEILVGEERVRKGKKMRECLVTPKKKAHTRIRIKTSIRDISSWKKHLPGTWKPEQKRTKNNQRILVGALWKQAAELGIHKDNST